MPYQINTALSPEQKDVCFLKGTEPPFSGKYVDFHERGLFTCVNCHQILFSSDAKFDSDSGWPSFSDVVDQGNVILQPDDSLGVQRTEVVCENCGSHLGHVFDDGKTETKKRYCVNSLALDFEKIES